MLRLHYPEPLSTGLDISLSKDSAHHLIHVMRAKVEDKFIVFNKTGEFLARIIEINKKSVIANVFEQSICNTESDCNITLIQAVTRRERMDYSIQKATELGVNCIQPVLTEHCVVKLDASKSQKRIAHWQGIAQHASEQSGRLVIPIINPILTFKEALENLPEADDQLYLIFALSASQPLCNIQKKSKNITLALGPVGGFSEKEVLLAQTKGFQAIKLGPRILRAETATTAALTAIQMRWGDMNTDQEA